MMETRRLTCELEARAMEWEVKEWEAKHKRSNSIH
jgi:hypothetical protein